MGGMGAFECETMIERILDSENLRRAWQRVRSNAGAPGVDGMTVEDFPAFCRSHWPRIRAMLVEGTYRPAPVRRVFIPKPDGSQRPLGVPTVLDRVIQQAMAKVLTPLFEGGFSEHSYGFREGRNAHQAVRSVEAGWKEGRRYAVDCDLQSFFDTVNHQRLMSQLREKIKDRKVLKLIQQYLVAGVVLPDGTREATPQGVPQGGPLSPLLANIVLDPLDKELERRGHHFARYADDFLVLVKSAKAAERVMNSLIRFVEGRLKLTVNRAKSKAARLKQCSFLGFQIGRGRHRRTQPIRHGLDQLLPDQPHLHGGGGTGGVDPAKGAAVLPAFALRLLRRGRLEAMETTTDPPTPSSRAGHTPRRSPHGHAEPERILADECQQYPPAGADQPTTA